MAKMQQMLLVTVKSPQSTVDLELPGDEPVQDLLPLLIDICDLDAEALSPVRQVTTLWSASGKLLPPTSTLCDNSIFDGDIVFLQAGAQLPAHLMAAAVPATRQAPKSLQPGEDTGWIGVTWDRDPLF